MVVAAVVLTTALAQSGPRANRRDGRVQLLQWTKMLYNPLRSKKRLHQTMCILTWSFQGE